MLLQEPSENINNIPSILKYMAPFSLRERWLGWLGCLLIIPAERLVEPGRRQCFPLAGDSDGQAETGCMGLGGWQLQPSHRRPAEHAL